MSVQHKRTSIKNKPKTVEELTREMNSCKDKMKAYRCR